MWLTNHYLNRRRQNERQPMNNTRRIIIELNRITGRPSAVFVHGFFLTFNFHLISTIHLLLSFEFFVDDGGCIYILPKAVCNRIAGLSLSPPRGGSSGVGSISGISLFSWSRGTFPWTCSRKSSTFSPWHRPRLGQGIPLLFQSAYSCLPRMIIALLSYSVSTDRGPGRRRQISILPLPFMMCLLVVALSKFFFFQVPDTLGLNMVALWPFDEDLGILWGKGMA